MQTFNEEYTDSDHIFLYFARHDDDERKERPVVVSNGNRLIHTNLIQFNNARLDGEIRFPTPESPDGTGAWLRINLQAEDDG